MSEEAIAAVGLVPDFGRRDICDSHCCLVKQEDERA